LESIFGIISKSGDLIDEELLQDCLRAQGQFSPKDSAIWHEDNVALAYQQVINTHDGESTGIPAHDSGLYIVADCRIDYRDELILELKINPIDANKIPDNHLILKSYLKWGESCVDYLHGDFAFAIWDVKKQKLFSARDQMGCRPFFYFEDDQYFLFSSNMNGFDPVPWIEFVPEEKYILHHFNSKALPPDKTLYRGICRLPPAHSLVLAHESAPVLKRYWDLEIDSSYAGLSLDEALLRFRDMLKEAVRQRIRGHSAIGLELSGGLDSSAVAVVAREVKQKGGKIHAFINALSEEQKKDFFPFYDESNYAEGIANYADLDSLHKIYGENGRTSLDAVMDAMETTHAPVIQLFPAFSDQLLDKVREQHLPLLLSGFGGDECLSYHARGILHEYAADGDWEKVRKAVRAEQPLKRMKILFKLFLEHSLLPYSEFLRRRVLNPKNRYKISDLAMDPAFLKPFMEIEEEWNKSGKPDEYRIREQQRFRLMHTSVSDRLENSYLLAQKRNIEYAYPLLDIKLLEFVYSLPVEYKFRDGLGRYMMRRAMEGLLPEEIRLRASKFGAAVPNIFYRFHLDLDKYAELIDEAGENNNFHYLDYEKLRWQIGKLMEQKNFVKLSFGPKVFFSSISLMILQKWKREGRINTGIKC